MHRDEDYRSRIDGADWREDDATAESMRSPRAARTRRRPSADDMRIRRQMRRGAVAQEESTMPQDTRNELLKAIDAAPSLREQARLVGQLDELDRGLRAQAALDAEVDLARTQIGEAMTPVASRTVMATTASDWLADDIPGAEVFDHNRIVAQAALWFQKVPGFVRADAAEFAEQARGAARQVTSLADGVAVFTDYAGFLRERTAASGVPQIQQLIAPDGVTQQGTPLPPEVFDTFAPPVADINAGADGAASSSDRAPAIQQAVNNGGNSTPEQPGGHSETGVMTGPGPEPSLGGGGGNSAPEQPGGHEGAVPEEGGPAQPPKDPSKHEAASGLPMIQQTTDTHDAAAATPMPDQVAFPWTMGGPEEGLEGEAHYDQGTSVPASHQSTGVRHVADQWTQPSQLVEPDIANSARTTPPRTPADAGSGAADAKNPEAFPSFGDAHAAPAYTESYSAASPESPARDVPVSMGGDNGQSEQHPKYASQRIASRQEMRHPDFQRGYKYAVKWQPGVPLVRTGSPELEAGIFAAFTDRPQHRTAWLDAHARLAAAEPALSQRIAMHRQFTHQVAAAYGLPTDGTYLQSTAATGVDLDTTAPGTSPSPTGDTPINGPGRPGPLAGGTDAAAPGGPAPYNGAEPTGTPVVPPLPSVPTQGAPVTVPDTTMASPSGSSLSPAMSAFRRRVQAGRLNQIKEG